MSPWSRFRVESDGRLSDRRVLKLSPLQQLAFFKMVNWATYWNIDEIPVAALRLFPPRTTLKAMLDAGIVERTDEEHIRITTTSVGPTRRADIADRGGSGWTYVIQAGDNGPVKIGKTSGRPEAMLAALQTASAERLRLVAAFEGTHNEAHLHAAYAEHRLNGEWFDASVLKTMREGFPRG